MHSTAHAKMIRARSDLVLDLPFFASLALRLELREDRGCATAWSDGKVLGYNPAYIESMPLEKVKGLQCHEVLHLACCHHTRRKGRDARLWNRACDYAINPILLEAGIELPNGFLHNPDLAQKSVDAIYRMLADLDEERRGGYEGKDYRDLDSSETLEGDGRTSLSDDKDDETAMGGTNENKSEEQPEDKHDDTAEAAGNPDVDGEQPTADDDDRNDDPGMCGEVRDGSADNGESDGEATLKREEESWQVALAQAANKSREAGKLPGGLERLISCMLSPALPWTQLLRRFLSNAARNDFSWVHPNRRHLHAGLYLPGLHSEELANVAVAVDTSGSISQPEMDLFAAELSGVLEEFDTVLDVLGCDARLTSHERLSRADLPLEFATSGGGGTDFRPPFSRLEQEGVQPACMIYFTDLASNLFPEEPDFPVLWVCPDAVAMASASQDATVFLPPFGEVVTMERSL